MLCEQQEELHQSYSLAAGCKLLAAVSRRSTLGLASALGTWRNACRLQVNNIIY